LLHCEENTTFLFTLAGKGLVKDSPWTVPRALSSWVGARVEFPTKKLGILEGKRWRHEWKWGMQQEQT
jgi:hypothetical protein